MNTAIEQHLGSRPEKWKQEVHDKMMGATLVELVSEGSLLDHVDPDDYEGDYTDERWWTREHWLLVVAAKAEAATQEANDDDRPGHAQDH